MGARSAGVLTLSWQAATNAMNSALVGGLPVGVCQSSTTDGAVGVVSRVATQAAKPNTTSIAAHRIPHPCPDFPRREVNGCDGALPVHQSFDPSELRRRYSGSVNSSFSERP